MARSKREEEVYVFIKSSTLAQEILSVILRSDSGVTVGTISQTLQKKQPSISRSLANLTRNGFLEVRSTGRTRAYRVRQDKEDQVRRILSDIFRTQEKPSPFLVLAEEESVATSMFESLRKHPLEEEFLVTRRNTVTGRHLNHTFDLLILLRNKKTIGVNVVHGSKVDQLLATLSRWTDFKGKR